MSIDRLVAVPGCLDADTVRRTASGYRADAAGVPVLTVERLRLTAIDSAAVTESVVRNGAFDRVDRVLVDTAR
ncbi:hypothetical protein ACFV4K_11365 [Nocardia sp. NPDC059764]|uniref:hypothetical protein n=1 Tax=Nocardia sp. NPDC059764 TaxID=3346939 RepID=UPI003666EA98